MRFGDLPLNLKFLAILAGLLTAAVVAYFLLAIKLFDDDKTAFVYEGQQTLVRTLASKNTERYKSLVRTLRVLALAQDPQSAKLIFDDEPSLVDFAIYNTSATDLDSAGTRPLFYLINDEFFRGGMRREALQASTSQIPIRFSTALKERLIFENASDIKGAPLLRITLALSKQAAGTQKFLVAHIDTQQQATEFEKALKETTDYVIDKYGNTVIHENMGLMLRRQSLASVGYIGRILASKSGSDAGAFEATNKQGETLIIAYSRMRIGELFVISEIQKSKAFAASTALKEKSIQFGVLIILIAFAVSLLFTKRLTTALQRLYEATRKIAKGDFNIAVDVKNRDEVGALSHSFNYMAKRIVELLKATADKARMEKELETAHLVQENFFPISEIKLGGIEVAAFFKAASECGGDWWGHIKVDDDNLVLLIGDATGHGVPAALITAAAHSCCTTIEEIIRTHKVKISPAAMMETLNKTIYSAARGQVKMTFFIAYIQLSTGVVRYANASHELPLVSRLAEGESDPAAPRAKDDLDTLAGTPGNILGQAADAEYTEHSYKIRNGDVLVWFTDGLTECRSPADEEYGENRLMRSLVKSGHQDPTAIRTDIMHKATEFYGARPIEDDITLVVVKVNSLTANQRLAV